ncbi:granzyme A-like [Anguilla anguilla]|uniref:granzyme A-like n=1 Tax=Anguilla anguilla TaxID=7936 RepID=UPI0015B211FA|nr:granzyme A-like [Anguilla anguilla]
MKGKGHLLVCLPVLLLCLNAGEGAEIINGEEVEPHSLPFMSLLENSTGSPFCGGTLIDLQWVLTAAHCQNATKVLLGVHSRSKPEKESRQTRKVVRSVPHPKYKSCQKGNDLMLLKLDKKSKITTAVRPLSLPRPIKDIPAGTVCTVAGWGVTKNGGKVMSEVLLSANVTVIDRKLCNSKEYYNQKPKITDTMLCAGSMGKKRTDTCQGDSGGPLLCEGALRGVTSFGRDCGIKKKPGVYASLSKTQLEWIRKTINKPQ